MADESRLTHVDESALITGVEVVEKSGGRSDDWSRDGSWEPG